MLVCQMHTSTLLIIRGKCDQAVPWWLRQGLKSWLHELVLFELLQGEMGRVAVIDVCM